ncbi:MAG: ABC transporter permease [Candidatus Woesearchaeota archaeon]
MKLLRLIAKHLKTILRSKISALIIIFGPLFIMLLAGFAYNNDQTFDLRVGVIIENKTPLYERFVESLSQEFVVQSYEQKHVCVEDVRNLRLHSCLEFSSNFTLEQSRTNYIFVHVDNSKVNIVDLIQNSLNRVIRDQTAEISSELTSVLLVSIDDVSEKLLEWEEYVKTTLLLEHDGLIDSLDDATDQLGDLNFSTDTPNVISSLTGARSNVNNILNSYKNDYTKTLDDIENELDAMSGETDTSQAMDLIEQAREKITTHENTTTQRINQLNAAISLTEDAFSDLQEKVRDAGKLQQSFTSRFGQLQDDVESIKTNLLTLAADFAQVNAALQGIEITDATSIVRPVEQQVQPVITTENRLNYIFPSLVILVIMFVSLMLGSTIVVIEKVSPAKFRIFATPTSDYIFILSIFFTTILVAVLQMLLLLSLGYFLFEIDVLSNIGTTLTILLLAATIFTSIGMIIGYIFSNEQTTILAAISLGSAFILVSDFILPLESVPSDFRGILEFTPFILLSTLLRRSVLFDAQFAEIVTPILAATIYAFSLLIVIIVAHKLLKFIYILNTTRRR